MRRARTAAYGALAAVLGYAALASFAEGAGAEEPAPAVAPALTWEAPIACPDEASVRGRIAALLAGSSAPVEARAEAKRVGERWQVLVVMNGGERRLEADSCFALAEATALIVAMAVDPVRVAANRAGADAGPPPEGDASLATPVDAGPADAAIDAAPQVAKPLAPVAAPLPVPVAPRAPPPSSPRSPPARFAVSASASLDFGGLLPATSVGPSLGVAWIPGSFRVDLVASYFPPTSSLPIAEATESGARARFWLFDTVLRACYLPRLGPFDLGPCAGAQLGTLHAYSQDIFTPGSASNLTFAFDAGVLAAWRLTEAWALFARGDALLQVVQEPFGVTSGTSQEAIYSPSLFTGRASAGLELRF